MIFIYFTIIKNKNYIPLSYYYNHVDGAAVTASRRGEVMAKNKYSVILSYLAFTF